jgi:hypothetical protein
MLPPRRPVIMELRAGLHPSPTWHPSPLGRNPSLTWRSPSLTWRNPSLTWRNPSLTWLVRRTRTTGTEISIVGADPVDRRRQSLTSDLSRLTRSRETLLPGQIQRRERRLQVRQRLSDRLQFRPAPRTLRLPHPMSPGSQKAVRAGRTVRFIRPTRALARTLGPLRAGGFNRRLHPCH